MPILDHDNFIKTAKKSYSMQKTVLDKLTYLFNVMLYKEQLKHYKEGINRDYSLARPTGFKDNEKLNSPYKNKADVQHDFDIVDELEDFVTSDIMKFASSSVKNMEEYTTICGMFKANLEINYGKLRKKLEDSDLFVGEKNRSAMLDHYCNNLTGNVNNEFMQIMSAYTLDIGSIGFDNENGIPAEKTPLKDLKYIKKVTIKQFAEDNRLTKEMTDMLIDSAKEFGNRNYPEEANAYTVFKQIYMKSGEFAEQERADMDDAYDKLDERLLSFIGDNYYISKIQFSHMLHGDKLIENNIDQESKNFKAEGKRLTSNTDKDSVKLSDEELKAVYDASSEKRLYNIDHAIDEASRIVFTEKALNIEDSKVFSPVFPKVNKDEKSYDNYIKLHTGINAFKTKDNLKTTLAKCIAAESLKAMPGFDIKMLHRVAKRIEEFPTIEKLSPDEIVDTLSHPSKISAMQKRFFREAHSVDPNNCQYYSDQLQKLHENMMPKEGRSTEYKNLYDAVERVADIDPDSPNYNETIMKANENLLQAVRVYIKGKESIRSTTNGNDRFNNALDVLGIMSDNVPGLQKVIDGMVNNINKKRGIKDDEQPGFIDIDDYGADRAAERKQERENAKNKPKPEKKAATQKKAPEKKVEESAPKRTSTASSDSSFFL